MALCRVRHGWAGKQRVPFEDDKQEKQVQEPMQVLHYVQNGKKKRGPGGVPGLSSVTLY
jgi:hypothetical protein